MRSERAWAPQCWKSCVNGSNIVALRFGDHRTKEMLGVVGWKAWPVSNFAQQHATTSNNMQQGVQTDATCNFQHCRQLLANNVASVCTGLHRVFSFTWPASMQIYWNKRKCLHKKRVQLPQDWFGTPTWPPFHCFGTPIWPPWRHSMVISLRTVEVLTLPVAAKPTLRATVHVQFRSRYTTWLPWRTILFYKHVVSDRHSVRCHLSRRFVT